MRAILIGAMLVATTIVPANAQGTNQHDGNDLLDLCSNIKRVRGSSNPEILLKAGTCVGYIRGIMHSIPNTNYLSGRNFICMPTGVQTIQAIDIVIKYLNDHPERRHLHQSELALHALWQAFPCRD